MNLVSTPDDRIINLDHLTYAERTGEDLVLHLSGGADAGIRLGYQAEATRRRKASLGIFG
jgi:hypothetical protein